MHGREGPRSWLQGLSHPFSPAVPLLLHPDPNHSCSIWLYLTTEPLPASNKARLVLLDLFAVQMLLGASSLLVQGPEPANVLSRGTRRTGAIGGADCEANARWYLHPRALQRCVTHNAPVPNRTDGLTLGHAPQS